VERYFIDSGWLLPDFYQNWWIGLNKNATGSWVWTDGLATRGRPAACCVPAASAGMTGGWQGPVAALPHHAKALHHPVPQHHSRPSSLCLTWCAPPALGMLGCGISRMTAFIGLIGGHSAASQAIQQAVDKQVPPT
jgi:hypothetical protein